MPLASSQTGSLERLCGTIRLGPPAAGIERARAFFHGRPFAPHRHDTYGIGITTAGVQTFRYRGELHRAEPGQCHILHPDEPHDGAAGTCEGFGYRIVHIDPALVQQALQGRGLPFVRAPVLAASHLPTGFAADVWDIETTIDDLARTGIVEAVASLLTAASGEPPRGGRFATAAVSRVRDLIAACPAQPHLMNDLERIAGLDRWTLARQFRALFGISPSRFRTHRRLDLVRQLLLAGTPLAAAAIDAGFADQSHMSRQFKQACGLTPAAWRSAVTARLEACPPIAHIRSIVAGGTRE
jgi:AraC-like DNA-binding protein